MSSSGQDILPEHQKSREVRRKTLVDFCLRLERSFGKLSAFCVSVV